LAFLDFNPIQENQHGGGLVMIILPSRRDRYGLQQDSNTKALIHSNTTDGSTTFADAMGTHSPAVGAADVSHDTAQKKWGSSSILFDGDSGYLTIPDHADWDMGSGKFTIDFWVRIANLPAGNFDFFSIYQTALIYMTLRFTNQGGGNYNSSD
jgi:hypothetical protein